MKRTLSLLLVLCLTLTFLPAAAFAAGEMITVGEVELGVGDYTVDGETKNQGYAEGVGYAYFDESGDNMALLLTNFKYEGKGSVDSSAGSCTAAITYTGSKDLHLMLTGENVVTQSGTGSDLTAGIYSEAKVVVYGIGSLTATGGNSKTSYGIYADDVQVNVSNSSLIGRGGTATEASHGVVCKSAVVGFGNLTGIGGSGKMSAGVVSSTDIAVEGGSLTGIGGTAEDISIGVYATNSLSIEIGSLSGKGGEAKKSSYGCVAENTKIKAGETEMQGGTAGFSAKPDLADNAPATVWYGESRTAAESAGGKTPADFNTNYVDTLKYTHIKFVMPEIIEPTEDQTVTATLGEKVTLSVTAKNATIYEWYRSGTAEEDYLVKIEGAAGPTYEIDAVTFENDGVLYFCRVMDDLEQKAYSGVFTLKVVEPGTEPIPTTGDDTPLLLTVLLMGAGLLGFALLRKKEEDAA